MSQHSPSPPASVQISSLLEQLLELVPQAIWLANDRGELVRLNTIGQRYVGMTTPEVTTPAALGEPFWQFFHSDDRAALEQAWQNGVRQQREWQVKSRLQMADGSYEWFEVTAAPTGSESDDVTWFGKLTRLASVTSDPHLLAGQEFLEALFENVSEGLVACNSDGQIVLFNRAAQDFHGLPPQPISPDRWSQYYDLYDHTGEQSLAMQDVPLMRALSGEHVRSVEIMIKPNGGPARSVLTNADPIINAGGRQLGAVAAMCDITAQKQMEAALLTKPQSVVPMWDLTDADSG